LLARSRERSANAERRWTCERKKGVFVSENAPLLSMAISRILYGRDNRGTVMIIYLSDIPEDFGLERFRDRRAGCPSSVLSCTAWGFSCLANYFASGELLPRLFTLASSSKNGRYIFCDTLRQPRLAPGLPACFTRHAAVWCSDFPLANPSIHQRSSAISPQFITINTEEKRLTTQGCQRADLQQPGNCHRPALM